MVNHSFVYRVLLLLFFFSYIPFSLLRGQSFSVSELTITQLTSNPTALSFGSDNRLYITTLDGYVYVVELERASKKNYIVNSVEVINEIREIVNHNDDGTIAAENDRQITGLYVTGTADSTILYVTSSDPRIGGNFQGNDSNLDTNSGVISKLYKEEGTWKRIDIVRGLPRSEENHATNGLTIDTRTNLMYVAQGGNTNAGAPSNNFAFATEHALSAAILEIDLNHLESLPVQYDTATLSYYIYDLPTVNDPTRADVMGQDIHDPFGGNDGLNQSKIVLNGPVQVYAPGFRNTYDILLTEDNKMYTWDNGANKSWGGFPVTDSNGLATNNWEKGELGTQLVNNLDGIHLIDAKGYYGGHPNPIRAFPESAGLFTHDPLKGISGEAGIWRTSISENMEISLPIDWPPLPSTLANPVEGTFQNPLEENNAFYAHEASTNGLTEYTSSNLGKSLKGNILAASFDGNIYSVTRNEQGKISSLQDVSILASGFGFLPLDITAQGDDDIFPGTFWVASFGSSQIHIFEPTDYENPIRENPFIHINAGSDSLTFNNTFFEKDTFFTGGATIISNATSPFESYREGIMNYKIPLLNNQNEITLYFYDNESTSENQRVFDILLDGEIIFDGLDIFDEVGQNNILTKTINYTTSSDTLEIEFQALSGLTIISAISIEPIFCIGFIGDNVDEDGDLYTNDDEIANGSDICNGAFRPSDFDQAIDFGEFKRSDLLDTDDDNDGLDDILDHLAIDSTNGRKNTIPINYPLLNGDPGEGFYGVGFTGLMTNGDTDYLNLIADENNSSTEIVAGGAVGLFTINNISTNNTPTENNLKNGYQFGIPVGDTTSPIEITSTLVGPMFNVTSTALQAAGIFLSDGSQDNYCSISAATKNDQRGIQVLCEDAGLVTEDVFYEHDNVGSSSQIHLRLDLYPTYGKIQPMISFDQGQWENAGSIIDIESTLLNSIQNIDKETTVGILPINNSAENTFSATWDDIIIDFKRLDSIGDGSWTFINEDTDCDETDPNHASCSQGRHESSYVHTGEKFYLLGGRENNSNINIYDPITKDWKIGDDAPYSLHHFQATEYQGNVIIAGAFTGFFPLEEPINRILIYDPVSNEWMDGPAMPNDRLRGSAGTVIKDDKLYILSGIQRGHVSGWIPWVDMYDFKTNEWSILPDAPRSRDHFHASIYQDKIYLIGGRRSGQVSIFEPLEPLIDVYDISENTWTTLNSSIPTPRASPTTARIGNELIYIGGETTPPEVANNEVEAFDVISETWRTLAPLNEGRHGTQAIVNNDNIWIAAGSPSVGGGSTQSHEQFTFDTLRSPVLNQITKGKILAQDTLDIKLSTSSGLFTLSNTEGNQALLIEEVNLSNGSITSTPQTPFFVPAGESVDLEVNIRNVYPINDSIYISVKHNGINKTNQVFVTQTNDLQFSTITPYPNPVSDYLNIPLHHLLNKKVEVLLTNTLGEEISRQTFPTDHGILENIGLSYLSPGLYIITINSNQKDKKSYKVIVK